MKKKEQLPKSELECAFCRVSLRRREPWPSCYCAHPIIPVHPRPPPKAGGTTAVIAVALRNYNDALADVALYNGLRAALLMAQILLAVNASILSALKYPTDFGFGDVTPLPMLIHLHAE
jgi:hypothetical protein